MNDYCKVETDHVGSLIATRSRNDITLPIALLELIDNSRDAGASEVRIYEDEGDLVITDNGRGFSDLQQSLIIGRSPLNSPSARIGRYGVGLKTAAIKYSSATTIDSNGKQVTVDWDSMIDSDAENHWPIVESKTDLTTIRFHYFRSFYKNAINTDRIKLAYAAALESQGFGISINGINLKGPPLPEFTESIDEAFVWRGRNVRLTGGIYSTRDPNQRPWSGYFPYYNGRMVSSGGYTDKGCGDYGCRNYCFQLHLSDGDVSWNLSTHKDAIEDVEELIEHCFTQYTDPLLSKADRECEYAETKDIERALNEAVAKASGNITRSTRTRTNTRTKTESDGPVKEKTRSDDASGRYSASYSKNKSKTAQFCFQQMGSQTFGMTQKKAKSVITYLNVDNSFISENRRNLDVMKPIVLFLYELYRDKQIKSLIPEEDVNGIMDRIGEHLHEDAEPNT